MEKEGFVYNYLVWFIAFLVGIILANYGTRYLGYIHFPVNVILINLYYGLVIELCSKVMQYFVFGRKAKMSINYLGHFLLWVIIQAVVVWIGFSIVGKINWLDLLMALGYFGMRYEFAIKTFIVAIIQLILIKVVWFLMKNWRENHPKQHHHHNHKRKNSLYLGIVLVIIGCAIFYIEAVYAMQFIEFTNQLPSIVAVLLSLVIPWIALVAGAIIIGAHFKAWIQRTV